MNKQERQRRINDNLRLLDFRSKSGSHVNCIRISTANTLEHEIEKLIRAYHLMEHGSDIITEAVFENGGGRADLIDLLEGIVYEIVNSETEESITKKIIKYPLPVEVVKVE
jgi:hypothetical protein